MSAGIMRSPTHPSMEVESGLILLNSSCTVITVDRGAAAILNYYRDRSWEPAYTIDASIMEAVQRLSDPGCVEHVLRIDFDEFICRTYLLESQDTSVTQPLVALLLERHLKARDVIDQVGAQYHLTQREQQALRGLSLGLSTRALAATMNIKPSTLRAFLRLIKIKMGVRTRAEIMVKIIQEKFLSFAQPA